MQENPSSKTVRGLGIAVIILSALCLIALIASAIGVGIASTAVVANSSEIADAAGNIQPEDFIDIEMDADERAQLETALETLEGFDDENAQGLINMLTMLDEGDVEGIANALRNDNGELGAAIDSFGSLTDEQLAELAEATGSDTTELIEARDALSQIDGQVAAEAINDLEITEDSVTGFTALTAGILYLLIAFAFICSLIALIAGIMAVRRAYKPEKLTAAFAISIVAAVFTFLSGAWITTILLIVLAVFISKARKGPALEDIPFQPAVTYAPPSEPAVTSAPEEAAPVVEAVAEPKEAPAEAPAYPEPSEPAVAPAEPAQQEDAEE